MYLRSIFTIADLRNRVLFTFFCLLIFRLGAIIPLPGINIAVLKAYLLSNNQSGGFNLISYLDFFAGGAFSNFSIVMLGVVPYISSSIIMQLLVVTFPFLKRISEQEGGRKRIQKLTRYATIVVAIVQSFTVTIYAKAIARTNPDVINLPFIWFTIIAMLTVTTGTMFLLWIGDQINMRGIGNGVSLIIFAGILARMPVAIYSLIQKIQTGDLNPIYLIIVFVLFTVVVSLVVIEQRGQRKIPVFYAKRVVGRKMYGAQNVYIPFKINPSGVIPVIFASSLLTFPLQILQNINTQAGWLVKLSFWLRPTGPVYLILLSLLIIFFAYFYTQVTLNPIEIAKNIRENGGTIQGIRSEKMEEYFMTILNRIILPGAIFLSFIAIIPTLVQIVFRLPSEAAYLLGGTSMLILVGVDLDLMSQIEASQKMHHQGQTNVKGKIRPRNF